MSWSSAIATCICPVCGKCVILRFDGKVARHNKEWRRRSDDQIVADLDPNKYGPLYSVACDGVGCDPVTVQ